MKNSILLLLLLLTGTGFLFGATETFSNRISSTQINSTAVNAPQLSVYDGKYYDMLTNGSWGNDYANLKVSNKLVLGIDPAIPQDNALSGGVTVDIKYWYWNGSGFSTTTVSGVTLSVDYSMTETDPINEINSYTFANAHRIEVSITSVNGGGGFDVDDVYLEAVVEVERHYFFPATATGFSQVTVGSDEYIEFNWHQINGAETYELEWVHINDYVAGDDASSIAASDLNFDFYRNSTRVLLRGSHYRIPNVFDRGYLVFRVRGVGFEGSGFDKRLEGAWSTAESGVVSSLTLDDNYVYLDPTDDAYDRNMNWSHQVVYTEDGRRMEGVSYVDGLGRPRQSIGRNPVTNQVLVNNVYYGGMGGAMITDLTTPVESESMHHLVDFNHASGDTYFGAIHFDNQALDEDPECSYETEALDDNYGASKYYSSKNPDKEGPNARIPSADGYPFAKIEYMKDQTGRIRKVGGVGPEFQLGQGHDAQFYYSTPSQYELDRLFGSEAGYAEHYQRRVTIDANRQAYVEYFDMAGRIVASGLIGDAPDNLDVLDDNLSSTETVTMSSGIGSNNLTTTSMSLTSPFEATADGDYTFDYDLNPTEFRDEECLSEICFDCVYRLKLTITDVNCGDVIFTGIEIINGGDYDAACNPDDPYHLEEIVHLDQGQYNLVKTLEIAPEAVAEYWCMYIDNTTCVPTYADVFNALYEAADFPDCENTYDYNTEDGDCADMRAILLADMSPNGQYGQFTVSGGVYSSTDPISIYNTSNSLPGSGDWQTPFGGSYEDALGNPAKVEVQLVSPGVYFPELVSGGGDVSMTALDNGNYLVSPQYLLNLKDFILKFEDSWAEALLPYHPEYCYLQFCEANEVSQTYTDEMNAISTFDEACSEGYFAPLGAIFSSSSSGIYNACTTGNPDPAFETGGWGEDYATDAFDRMKYYITISGVTLSVWDYAILLARCPNETNPTAIQDCIDKGFDKCNGSDQFWIEFRSMYLDLKDSLYMEAEQAFVQNCDGGVALDVGVASPYEDAIPRFGYAYAAVTETYSSGTLSTEYDNMCEQLAAEYVNEWLGSLGDCPGINGLSAPDLDDLTEDLIALCSNNCSLANGSELSTTVAPSSAPFSLPNGGTLGAGDGINAVLALYIPGFTETNLCTELLISAPQPHSATYEEVPVLDTCGCNLLLELKQEYIALGTAEDLPPGVVTIEDFLYYQQGLSMEDINYLICHCERIANEWTTGYAWSEMQAETLHNLGLDVPGPLTCDACLGCEDLSDADEALETRFGEEFADAVNYEVIFTNYMNQTHQFTLTYGDYELFRIQCSGTEEDPICQASPELINFGEVLNLLAHRGQLLSESNLNLLTENIVYQYGELYEYLDAQEYVTYLDGQTLVIHFVKDESQLNCSAKLNLPSGADFDFHDIIGFEGIQPFEGSCGRGNEEFTVGVRYISCGKVQTAQLTGSSDCFPVQVCYCDPNVLSLCNASSGEAFERGPCYEPDLSHLYSLADEAFANTIEAAYAEFSATYMSNCAAAFETEEITRTGTFNQYQYTLFYYDQAGNLVKTVAPKGVMPLTGTDLTDAATSRETTTDIDNQQPPVTPPHEFVTESQYNSYGQVTASIHPDQVGATNYWYDRYGRIAASQNPVQNIAGVYAYILYDEQGRPEEAGLVAKLSDPTETILKADDLGDDFEDWVKFTSGSSTTRTEVTFTYYDKVASAGFSTKFKSGQQNLRLRVASVLYLESCTNTTVVLTDYQSAVHYSYDLHGNVIESLQDVPLLEPVKQDVKSTRYDFELISGNVKQVKYQEEEYNAGNSTWEPGRDRTTHAYIYDELNRLTEVFTSTDGGVHQSRDAHYRYFDYGPLARTELGEHKVQGQDFAYTLQGWIKGMNNTTLNRERDAGKDGAQGYFSTNANLHELFAPDITGYTLGYYKGDYRGIGNTEFEIALTSGGAFTTALKDLFNGNIAHSVMATQGNSTQGTVYTYDQLHRLKSSTVYEGNDVLTLNKWSNSTALTAFATAYTYDANGNLKTLTRNGHLSTNSYVMDNFSYAMVTGTNRLDYVSDAASASDGLYNGDIQSGQTTGNYTYDELGQLTDDTQEGMHLEWRKGDKKLLLQQNATKRVEYIYNPFGQRVVKIEKDMSGGSPVAQSDSYSWIYTYYAYDANGQVMSVYAVTMNDDMGTHKARIDDQMIYGAGRLGIIAENRQIYGNGYEALAGPDYTNVLGKKNYELTNWLGNVNAVITDRKVLDPDYQAGVWYDFSTSFGTWTTVTGCTPTYSVSAQQQLVTTGACSSTIGNALATASGKVYTFSIDLQHTGSNVSLKLYSSSSTTGGTLLTTIPIPAGSAMTTYRYSFTAANSFFRYELEKTSTTALVVKVDNIKLRRNNAFYKAVQVMKADYYPFGQTIEERTDGNGDYRYGYNGMEMNDELKGVGNSYTTEFRQYDPRLGRWMSLDPLMMQFPWMSPYVGFDDNPVFYTDPFGLETEGWGGKKGENGVTVWEYDPNITRENFESMGYTEYIEEGHLENFRVNDGSGYIGSVYLTADGEIIKGRVSVAEEIVISGNPIYMTAGEYEAYNTRFTSGTAEPSGEIVPILVLQDSYVASSWGGYNWDGTGEAIHSTLDMLGQIPVIGEVFDVTNAVYYACEGQWGNAAISMSGAVPVGGNFATGGRLAVKYSDDVLGAASKQGDELVSQTKGLRNTKHTANRHIDKAKYPEKSKYKKPNQLEKIQDKTIKKPDSVKVQKNGRVVYEKDMKRKIGTNGETKHKVVVDPRKGKIVTSYPTKQ